MIVYHSGSVCVLVRDNDLLRTIYVFWHSDGNKRVNWGEKRLFFNCVYRVHFSIADTTKILPKIKLKIIFKIRTTWAALSTPTFQDHLEWDRLKIIWVSLWEQIILCGFFVNMYQTFCAVLYDQLITYSRSNEKISCKCWNGDHRIEHETKITLLLNHKYGVKRYFDFFRIQWLTILFLVMRKTKHLISFCAIYCAICKMN